MRSYRCDGGRVGKQFSLDADTVAALKYLRAKGTPDRVTGSVLLREAVARELAERGLEARGGKVSPLKPATPGLALAFGKPGGGDWWDEGA